MIRRYEEADSAARSAPPQVPSRAHIERIKAARQAATAAARSISAEIDATNERLNSLLIDRSQRARRPWSRWLPDRETDAVIAGLEAHRDTLRSQYGTLQTSVVRAEVREAEASRALLIAQAEADRDRRTAIRNADKRMTILARARKLLRLVPMLAYVGAKRLLAMATRIESAKQRGYDSGPTTTDAKVG